MHSDVVSLMMALV